MKKKTLFYLNSFIQNKMYDQYVSRPFIALFKNYADKEIRNINDFKLAAEAFIKFVMINKNLILMSSENLSETELRSDLNEIASVINRLLNVEQAINQDNFVNMVEYFINKNIKVLDVGAGGVPFSAMRLGRNNNNISAMDKFIISDRLIKKNNVNPIDCYFNEKTNISKFDMVVGLKPCSAIGHIVDVCRQKNKPYLLYLCECGAFDYAASKAMISSNWGYILPKIDKDVKLANGFATNLDLSEDKLKKIIYKKCKLTQEMQSCGTISFMESFSKIMKEFEKESVQEKTIVTPTGVVSISKSNVEGEWKVANDEINLEKE